MSLNSYLRCLKVGMWFQINLDIPKLSKLAISNLVLMVKMTLNISNPLFLGPAAKHQGAFVGTAAAFDRTAAAELRRCGAAAAEHFGAAGTTRTNWNQTQSMVNFVVVRENMGTLYLCHCLTHFASGIWKCLYLWAKSQRSKTKIIKHFSGRNRKKWRNMSLKWHLMVIRHISLKNCCFQIQMLLATYSHIRSIPRSLKCDIATFINMKHHETTSNQTYQTTIFLGSCITSCEIPRFLNQELQLNLSRAHRLHLLRLVAPQLTLLKMPPMTVTTATPRRVCLTCDRPWRPWRWVSGFDYVNSG